MSDCGCWTNDEGYWELSEKCRQRELDQWALAWDMSRMLDHDYRHPTQHELAVAYFRQELMKDSNDLE